MRPPPMPYPNTETTSHVKRNRQPRGSDREKQTLAILEKFRQKISHADENDEDEMEDKVTDSVGGNDDDDEYEDVVGTAWWVDYWT